MVSLSRPDAEGRPLKTFEQSNVRKTVPMNSFVMTREFPLPRIQTGAVLGNSYLGIMVWGAGDLLNISVGCGALWDHRGGMEWTDKINLKDIHQALLRKDEQKIKEMFDCEKIPGQPIHPCLVPVGRIELHLEDNSTLTRYELFLSCGLLQVFYKTPASVEKSIVFRLDMEEKGRFAFRASGEVSFSVRDSWTMSNGLLAAASIPPPERIATENGQGFANAMPADEGFGMFCRRDDDLFSVRFARSAEIGALKRTLESTEKADFDELTKENTVWWENYWRTIPEVGIDNPQLEELYWYGLYKFGAMTDPSGCPAGLQGPWIEDDDFPPWSGDYHFNINVEMCYWPSYRANRPENLKRLFKMLEGWKEKLRHNAKCLVGIDDGLLLPHAVDDRGVCMGNFWTGTIDHACSAWMAQMMFDYCDYFSDFDYLRETAFDFMKSVMRVFREMLKYNPDGMLELPVSVSPEYGGEMINAWGKNSSFQLAAIHRLAENLLSASEILDVPPDPFWTEIREKLPLASIYKTESFAGLESFRYPGTREIALWEGQPLEESHRHHSHLAGICPFNTLDQEDPEWKEIITVSKRIWQGKGMGMWSGWGMVWGAMLNARLNGGESAELTLEIFKRFYTNEGGNSLHDTNFKGIAFMTDKLRKEIMQMDSAMGAVAAIQEMFVHSRRNVLHVGTIPKRWKNSFVKNMPAPGGFRVSGYFDRGTCSRLEITATRDNTLHLALPVPAKAWRLPAEGSVNGDRLTVRLKAGETLVLNGD